MLKRFLKDESGQGMVEYALIIALIAIVLVAALTGVKEKLSGKFEEIEAALTPAPTPAN